MSELPQGWAFASLNELQAQGGVFADGDWIESKDQDPNGRNRLLQLADIGDGRFIDKSSRYVNDETFDRLNCTALEEGDILLARMPDPLGRACLMPRLPQRCLTVVDVAVFRSGSRDISHRWLMHTLNASPIREEISRNASGTTRKRIARGKLAELKVPVPPAAEQKRIAQKLDALLAQVDTLKARIDAIPALLKRFRMSILTAATSGTTFDGSSVITNQSEAKGSSFMLNDETFDLPKGWSHAPVDSVLHSARRLCYGVVQPGSEVESGVDMIRVCDIEDGTIAWNDLRKIASEVDDEYRRSRVQRGDVLMSIVGSIGRAAIVREDRPVNIARAVARLSVDQSQLTPEWLFLWLTSPKVQWWLVSSSREVARKTLNLKELSELPVPLPPREVQAEIVRRVEQLFAYTDQLEAKVAAAKQRIDALTQSLLAKAFRGELVPQDPSDEPASVLLERIRTQRAATPKPKRGRKKV